MQRIVMLSVLAAACGPFPFSSPNPPAVGATNDCARYGGSTRVVKDGIAACRRYRGAGRYVVGYQAGAQFVHLDPLRSFRRGPAEGTDRWGMRVRGWYFGERDGGWQFTDERGIVRAEGQFSNGKRVGKWTIRYANGSVASVVGWRLGMRDGDAWYGYPDGTPWWQGRYKWNKAEGTWVHWDRAGRRLEVNGRRSSVGPLAEPLDRTIEDDRECPYEDVGDLMLELEARSDVVTTRERLPPIVDVDGRIFSGGDIRTYALADGFRLGTIRTVGGDANEIIDENGEVVIRRVKYDVACHDEGGRRVETNQRTW